MNDKIRISFLYASQRVFPCWISKLQTVETLSLARACRV